MVTKATLTGSQRIKLTDLLRERYTSSGLTDEKFADAIRAEVCPALNWRHVSNQRTAAGIPSNVVRVAKIDAADMAKRIVQLETQMLVLSRFAFRLEPSDKDIANVIAQLGA